MPAAKFQTITHKVWRVRHNSYDSVMKEKLLIATSAEDAMEKTRNTYFTYVSFLEVSYCFDVQEVKEIKVANQQ